jgi:hypothetical protein
MPLSGGSGGIAATRAKLSSGAGAGALEDRLSVLPDDVLVLILVRLSTVPPPRQPEPACSPADGPASGTSSRSSASATSPTATASARFSPPLTRPRLSASSSPSPETPPRTHWGPGSPMPRAASRVIFSTSTPLGRTTRRRKKMVRLVRQAPFSCPASRRRPESRSP